VVGAVASIAAAYRKAGAREGSGSNRNAAGLGRWRQCAGTAWRVRTAARYANEGVRGVRVYAACGALLSVRKCHARQA